MTANDPYVNSAGSAGVRYLVIPRRPAGTDDLDESQLASLVTRDSMIGVSVLPEMRG